MHEKQIEWTDYMRYRAALRGFDLARIEDVVRYSNERYLDNATGRLAAVAKDGAFLVLVAYEIESDLIRPITVHVVTRKQISSRIKSGRFTNE